VFESLAAAGVSSTACLGDLATWPGPWLNAIVRGAHPVKPLVAWRPLRLDASAITRWAIDEVRRTVGQAGSGVVWIHVDYDPYIHRSGPDDGLRQALTALEEAVSEWTSRGCAVLAYSDHGLTPNASPDKLMRLWENISAPELCWLPPGGAGRVRWMYPKPAREREVRQRLVEALDGDGIVCTYRELVDLELLPDDAATARRLGSVIALASGPRFPVPQPSDTYEHGSCTAEEMFAFVSTWRAAG